VTSFHLLPPYHQPLCIRRLARQIVQATYLQNATPAIVAGTDDKSLDWSTISSNVIATVLGGALLALAGGVLYIAWQVPRQQDQILFNQVEMKRAVMALTDRMDRLEANDQVQNERLIKQENR
jgi:hypothetical protein